MAFDAGGNWVIPTSVTGVNTSSQTCHFSAAFTGTCTAIAVLGTIPTCHFSSAFTGTCYTVSAAATLVSCSLSSATSCTLSGASVGGWVVAQDVAGNWAVPQGITGLTTTAPTCTFSSAFTGNCYASAAPQATCSLSSATSCTISGAIVGATVSAFDNAGNWVAPSSITGLNTTSPTCTFSSAFTGTCSATARPTIRYTTDGSTPSSSHGTIYTTTVTIAVTTTLKAIAYATSYPDSSVTSGLYIITLPTVGAPTFSPPAGVYPTAQSVTITTVTGGATIRYTVDGSTPTETHGVIYTTAVSISVTTVLQAIGYEAGFTDSTVTSGTYTITGTVANPTFSPPAGTYTSAQIVTISTATPGATIRYTTDGTIPTATYGAIYLLPVIIFSDSTLKAVAYETGWVTSGVTSGAYIIDILPSTTITGTFKYPNNTPLTGHLTIALTKSTVTNSCGTASQALTFRQVSVAITAGALGTLALYPSPCLSVVPPSTGSPLAFPGPAAGVGATVSVTCSSLPCNVSGVITVTTGTGTKPGTPYSFTTGSKNLQASTLAIMSMTTTNGNQPLCTLFPASSNAVLAGTAHQFSIGQQLTNMTLVAGASALAASTSYSWAYSCVQPYTVYVYDQNNHLLYHSFWTVPATTPVDVSLLDGQ